MCMMRFVQATETMAPPNEPLHESLHDEVDTAIIAAVKDRKNGAGARDILESLARQGHRISQVTLTRRIDRLIQEKHIARQGQARATRYFHDPYHDWFAVPPNKRPPVAYDPSFLENYRPDVDAWLTPEERTRLEMAGGGRRLDASTYSRAIAQKLLVDLSWASSALEGNTYSYLDTQVLIEFGQAAEGKSLDETVMILNHKEAINHIVENIEEIEVSVRDIKDIHALLSRGLSNMAPQDIGEVRQRLVDIGGSSYKPLAIPQRIREEFDHLATKARQIENPFEQSIFLLVFVSYLQAFRDVNKRTGRLVCNIPLLKSGLAPFSFMDVDKAKYVEGLLAFYELGRIDIIRDAYVEGYVRSAARYDAYSWRPREIVEIEFKRRNDIYQCVRDYVAAFTDRVVEKGVEDFAEVRFADENETVRRLLVGRISEITNSLAEGNHIAYGISRRAFDDYKAVLEKLGNDDGYNR